MKKIICVVGPTATGKTNLAIDLALKLDGEVISCDSMQVYRGMTIGTAQPRPEELRGVKHHLLAVADPKEPFSVGKFVALADPILQDILARGKRAILAGGTGLYIDSLVHGRSFAPIPQTGRREALQDLANREGAEFLLEQLREVDPESAARLHPGNKRRIIRALEVYQETGKTITRHNAETAEKGPKYDASWLGLTFADRSELYNRIDRRVEQMIQNGLLQETKALLEQGLDPDGTALQAIGYKQLLPVIRQNANLDDAISAIQLSTRRYAKRQLTWFRRNPDIHWLLLTPPIDPAETACRALDLLSAE